MLAGLEEVGSVVVFVWFWVGVGVVLWLVERGDGLCKMDDLLSVVVRVWVFAVFFVNWAWTVVFV